MTYLYMCPNHHLRSTTDRRRGDDRLYGGLCPVCRCAGDWIETSPDYEILGVLGRGGVGVVFKARRRADGRLFALKVFLPAASHPADLEQRFHAEIRAMAQLRHPGIMGLEDSGRVGAFPFLVLELLEGGTLDAKVRDTILGPREAAELIETVARAVHHMHLSGIIHRDIKPSNILLDAEGRPRIADLGLVKMSEFNLALTQGGMIMGTPQYMAPEQARGEPAIVGRAADIYALGGTLYCAITGAGPWRGHSPDALLFKIVNEMPLSPRWLRPDIPGALDTICMTCLQKDERERYPTAEHLADDLRRFIEGEPIAVMRSESERRREVQAPTGVCRECDPAAARTISLEHGTARPTSVAYAPTLILKSEYGASAAAPRERAELAAFDLFAGIDITRINPLLKTGAWQTFEDGEDLMTEGSAADGLMLLASGTAEVFSIVNDEPVLVGRRGPGEVLGEMGLIMPHERRLATVRAVGRVRAFKLPGNPVQLVGRLADARTAFLFARNLIKIVNARLCERLRSKSPDGNGPGLVRGLGTDDSQTLLRMLEQEVAPEVAPMLYSRGNLSAGETLGGIGGVADGLYFVHAGTLEVMVPGCGKALHIIEAPCVVGDPQFGSGPAAGERLRAITSVDYTCIRIEHLERIEAHSPAEAVNVLFAIGQWLIMLIAKDRACDPHPLEQATGSHY